MHVTNGFHPGFAIFGLQTGPVYAMLSGNIN